jgi:spermidine synthase
MTRIWRVIETVPTPEGSLELRQRGDRDFLIVIGGRVLMTTMGRRSEVALADLACAALPASAGTRVLIGGLGMGYTLRAALDALPASARVVVAELSPEVLAWCRGPLAVLTDTAVGDPRVEVEIADVADVIAAADPGRYGAILLDLYEGPNPSTQTPDDRFYGASALSRARRALAVGGILAVWSEEPDPAFERRFAGAGFDVEARRVGGGGRAHYVYLGRRS